MSKGKVSMTGDQITDKWGRRMSSAVPDIQAGIDALTENPLEQAAGKADKMLQNLTQSVTSGRWASALRKVNFSDWKIKTKQKVAERLAGGVQAAIPKRKAFDQWLVGTLNNVLPEIKSMPDFTLEDSVNRVRRLMEHMKNNRYKQ